MFATKSEHCGQSRAQQRNASAHSNNKTQSSRQLLLQQTATTATTTQTHKQWHARHVQLSSKATSRPSSWQVAAAKQTCHQQTTNSTITSHKLSSKNYKTSNTPNKLRANMTTTKQSHKQIAFNEQQLLFRRQQENNTQQTNSSHHYNKISSSKFTRVNNSKSARKKHSSSYQMKTTMQARKLASMSTNQLILIAIISSLCSILSACKLSTIYKLSNSPASIPLIVLPSFLTSVVVAAASTTPSTYPTSPNLTPSLPIGWKVLNSDGTQPASNANFNSEATRINSLISRLATAEATRNAKQRSFDDRWFENEKKHHLSHKHSNPTSSITKQDKRNHRHHYHKRRRRQNYDFSNSESLSEENHQSNAERPLVVTSNGLLRGITQKTATGKMVDAFLGIPYAQPPLGKLRFRHPQAANPWRGERDAGRFSKACLQNVDTYFGPTFAGSNMWNPNTPISEDCLYLNIWAPFGAVNNVSTTAANKLPVLVWIFGGGFTSGSGSLSVYNGGLLASEEDIILVTLNYRVSSLGFLYLSNPTVPGNAGLFDQVMALQWVSENIARFGGDPKRVTLFGESSGAVSISYHMLSPLSRDLFSRAILQSGAATNPWALTEPGEMLSRSLQLATLVGCDPTQNKTLGEHVLPMDAIIDCLQTIDAQSIVARDTQVKLWFDDLGRLSSSNSGDQYSASDRTVLPFFFVPIVDGSLLVESPIESMQKQNFKRTSVLLGSNSEESNFFLAYFMSEYVDCTGATTGAAASNQITPTSSDINEFGDSLQVNRQVQIKPHYCVARQKPTLTRQRFLASLKPEINPFLVSDFAKTAIAFEYTNWSAVDEPEENTNQLDKLVGDYQFVCHVNEFAQQMVNAGNSVHMYLFKQRPSTSAWPPWMGALHGDEIPFLFGEPLDTVRHNYTRAEQELSRRMMRYWANFARTGNPNDANQNRWPEHGKTGMHLELIANNNPSISKGAPRARQCAFWAHQLPQLLEAHDKVSKSKCEPGMHQYAAGVESSNANQQKSLSNTHLVLSATRALAARAKGKLGGNSNGQMVAVLIIMLLLATLLVAGYAVRLWKPELFAGIFSSSNNCGNQTVSSNAANNNMSQQGNSPPI